jgi:predicted RNA-binding Zn ribbon-like protein
MTTLGATERYQANKAPGDLAIAQDLANTVGVGPESDLLADAGEARRWLASITQHSPRALCEADLTRLRSLRAALRTVLHSDGSEDADEAKAVVSLQIDRNGISLRSETDPVDTLTSRVAYALIQAQARGELPRLKLCANPRCQVAFFDESRNGGGRWHSSARCGNAARVRAHRDRTTPAA